MPTIKIGIKGVFFVPKTIKIVKMSPLEFKIEWEAKPQDVQLTLVIGEGDKDGD